MRSTQTLVKIYNTKYLIENFCLGRNRSQAETQRRTMQVLTNADEEEEGWEDEATLNERRLLSRYGVWLLVSFNDQQVMGVMNINVGRWVLEIFFLGRS